MELAENQYIDVAPNLDLATTTVSFGSGGSVAWLTLYLCWPALSRQALTVVRAVVRAVVRTVVRAVVRA